MRRPTIGVIYNPRQGQVKNVEIAAFPRYLPGTSLVCEEGNRYLADSPIRDRTPASKPPIRADLDMVLIVMDLYLWLLLTSAILSWLIAFKVVNTRNQFVAALAAFLLRVAHRLNV